MARPPNPTVVRDPNRPPPAPPRALTPEEIEIRDAERKIEGEIALVGQQQADLRRKALRLNDELDRLRARGRVARMTAKERLAFQDALLGVGPGPAAPTAAGTPGAS